MFHPYIITVPAVYNDDDYSMTGRVYSGWNPCYRWCEENLCALSWYFVGEGVFEFANEKDMILFKLRWG